MPTDPSIALGIKPPEVQNPLQSIAQMMQIKQMQQGIAGNEAVMEHNRQLTAEEKKKQAEADTLNQIVATSPDRNTLLTRVQSEAPWAYEGINKFYSDADAKAATMAKDNADARAALLRAQTSGNEYAAHQAAIVAASGYQEPVLNLAMQHIENAMPDWKPHLDQIRQGLSQAKVSGNPADAQAFIKSQIDPLLSLNEATVKQANEGPGQVAESTQKQNVTAGMQGGLTPEQLVQRAAENRRLDLDAARVELERKRLNLQQPGFSPEDLVGWMNQYTKDPAMADKMIAGRPDAKALKLAVTNGLIKSGVNVTQLTNQSKFMRESAQSILPMIDKVQTLGQQIDQMGLMGTVGGRERRLAAGESAAASLMGLTPEQRKTVGEFASAAGLLNSGVARAHGGARGGGSIQMIEQMEKLLDAKNKDLPTYLGALQGARDWMQNYADMGGKITTGGAADFVWNPDTKKLEPAKK